MPPVSRAPRAPGCASELPRGRVPQPARLSGSAPIRGKARPGPRAAGLHVLPPPPFPSQPSRPGSSSRRAPSGIARCCERRCSRPAAACNGKSQQVRVPERIGVWSRSTESPARSLPCRTPRLRGYSPGLVGDGRPSCGAVGRGGGRARGMWDLIARASPYPSAPRVPRAGGSRRGSCSCRPQLDALPRCCEAGSSWDAPQSPVAIGHN